MAIVDSTKLGFYSGWNTDKVIDSQNPTTNSNLSFSLGSGASTTVTVPHSYGFRPYVIAQYNPSPQSAWYDAGVNTQSSAEQSVEMYVWVRSNDIRFRVRNFHVSSVNVSIRYWVFSDGN